MIIKSFIFMDLHFFKYLSRRQSSRYTQKYRHKHTLTFKLNLDKQRDMIPLCSNLTGQF